jgi:heat-inducible transcriptional repressor
MDFRQQKILEAILDSFIKNALPVGSKHLAEFYELRWSPATIRSEMAALEEAGYIKQPHTSAGRIPTSRAYRMLVDQMKNGENAASQAKKDILNYQHEYYLKQTKEKLYDIVSILAGVTQNISFATLPDKHHVFYIGISNILRQPEFYSHPETATQVVEVLENQLADALRELSINEDGAIFIGEENILDEFQSCSLLAAPYIYKGFKGVMGVLGSTRMDYAYNMAALKSAVHLLA